MTPSTALEKGFTLGPWSVAPTRNIISRDGEERHLENRLMQTLVFLAQHPGQTLTREQFFDSVWEGRVVNEEALSRAISLLRSLLDDSAQSPQFIQTIPGVGYRLIAEVGPPAPSGEPSPKADAGDGSGTGWGTGSGANSGADTGQATAAVIEPGASAGTDSKSRWVITAILVLVALFIGVDRFVLAPDEPASDDGPVTEATDGPPASTEAQENSLAVLPFVNMSEDPAQEYFADGMTEELLNMLARVPNLRVTARTSSFFFKGKDLPITEIANALNVEHVLEGSVRRQGDTVRVTAQLIEAKTDRHLWSETIEREANDVFVIQDEVAAAIAGALATSFRAEDVEPVSRSSSLSAQEAYRTGRLLWWQRTPESLYRAIDQFELAMEADPGFAPAYAAAADTWMLLILYGDVHFWEGRDLAEPLIEQALELDPDSAEAHAAMGLTRVMYGRNIEAESHLRKALELDSTYIPAYLWLSNLLSNLGRIPEEGLTLRRALAQDPLNPLLAVSSSVNLQRRGLSEDAADALLPLIRLQPNNVALLTALSDVRRDSGELVEAWELANKAYKIAPESVVVIKTMASAWMALEEWAEAESVLRAGLEHSRRSVELKMQLLELLLIEGRAEPAEAVMSTLFPTDISTLGQEQQYTYHYYRGLLNGVKQDYMGMRDHLEQAIHPLESQLFDNEQIFVLTTVSMLNTALREPEKAEDQLAIAERVVGHARVNGLDNAAFYYSASSTLAMRGENELALQTLQQSYDRGLRLNWLLEQDGRMEPLRGTPEFTAIQDQVIAAIEAARAEVSGLLQAQRE